MSEPLKRCECGNFLNRVGKCPKCDTDPVLQLRRRARDMLNKAPIDMVIKVVEVLGKK